MVKLKKEILFFGHLSSRYSSYKIACLLLVFIMSAFTSFSNGSISTKFVSLAKQVDHILKFGLTLESINDTIPKSEVILVDIESSTTENFYYNQIDAMGGGQDSWLSVGFDDLTVSNFIYSGNKLRT